MTHVAAGADVVLGKEGWDWPVLVGAFIIQLVLPCVLPAYGIMVVDLVEEHLMPLFSCIWAPALYVAASAFSEPLCRFLASYDGRASKYVTLTGVALSSGGLISTSFVHHTLYSFFGFGVLGGAGACLVRARLDAVLQARLHRYPRAVDVALNVASALGQFLSPLYTHFLLQHYGLQGTPLMLAGVVMQAAIGSLLLSCRPPPSQPSPPSPPPRPRAGAVLDASSNPLIPAGVTGHHKVTEDERFVSDLTLDNVDGTFQYRHAYGINILPKIPEEGEDIDEAAEDSGEATRKPRATFSARVLEEVRGMERAPRRTGRKRLDGDVATRLLDVEAARTQVNNGRTLPGAGLLLVDASVVQDLSAVGRGGWRCRCCPCVANLRQALRTSYVVPTLLLHVAVRLCPMGFAALAPVAVRTHISESTVDEAMLTITISGFSWLCFLVTMPWLLAMATHRLKFLYSMGSFAAAAGLYLFSESTSHDQIILNCVIIGIGQGASLATSRKVVLDALGDEAVSRLSCLLDVTTGVVLLLAASIMGVFLGHEGGTTGCFVFLAVLQAASGLCWIVKPMMARFREHGHHDWSAGEFLHPG